MTRRRDLRDGGAGASPSTPPSFLDDVPSPGSATSPGSSPHPGTPGATPHTATATDTLPPEHPVTDPATDQLTRRSERRRHRRRDPLGILLGVVGELLITVGVFLGLFVVWQLWWTDLQARQFTGGVIADMGLQAAPDKTLLDADKRTDPPPVIQDVPEEAFAILHIPEFGNGYQVPIAEGVGLSGVLHKGLAGHYPDTAMVGEVGNFAVAGHRQSHGAIFHHIDQLEPGDPIVVQTREVWYVYRVTTDPHVVLPSAVEVIAPNPGNPGAPAEVASMTLTTCHPLWSIAERLVVHSELDYWAPVSAGTPAELLEG